MNNNIPHIATENPIKDNFFLNRIRINSLVQDAVKKPLTVVTAGAGFGKTHAISNFLSQVESEYIWIQFSDLDNLVARFWERFVAAFEKANPALMKVMRTLHYPTSAAEFHQILQLFEKEYDGKNYFILVLDDFHTLHNKSILAFLEMLVFADIPYLSIVIISRTKPPFNLCSMLARRSLSRISESDLRFTKEEIKQYYEQQKTSVNDEMLDAIYAYTEGWIFALYLVGLSIKENTVNTKKLISYTKIDVFELIEKEIFHMATKELQDFLVQISILEVVPSGLLQELAKKNPQIVEEFFQIKSLVQHEPSSDSYRLHNLFKLFLEEKANRLNKDEIERIQYKAACWYEANGQLIEAVDYYKRSNHYDEIISIILPVKQKQSYAVYESFVQLIDAAPKEIVKNRPIVKVARANFLFNNNKIEEAYESLVKIRREYEQKKRDEFSNAILGEVYITLALISLVQQTAEFTELFKLADQYLPTGSSLLNNGFEMVEGLNVCGIKNAIPGELEKHKAAMFEVAPYLARTMNNIGYGLEYLNAADAALMVGDLKGVEKYAYEAIYRAASHSQYDVEYMANFYLIRMLVAKGNNLQIEIILSSLREQANRPNNPSRIALLDVIEGWFYVKIGKMEKIEHWIIDEENTPNNRIPVIFRREHLVRADYLLAEERYYELLAFIEQQDIFHKKRGNLYARIQNEIERAIAYHYLGNEKQSIAALERAYTLSSPNNLIYQYIEYGGKMRTVINATKNNDKCRIPKEWLDMIYTKSNTYAKMLAKITSVYETKQDKDEKGKVSLTKREKEIITCLYGGLTREEMADNCNLSLNTVKSVLQNIYNKLGATNSVDAVRIATALEII